MEITLKPFADGDISLLEQWLQAEHVKPWFEHPDHWLHEARNRDGEYRFIRHFIIYADGAPIGFCQYYPYWESGEAWQGALPVEGTYSIDYMIGEAACLRKGCAREAIRYMIGMVAAEPDAKRLIVQPDQDNHASCNALQSAGFTFDGANGVYLMELSICAKTCQCCFGARKARVEPAQIAQPPRRMI